ncbi:MAG: hypothetical protein ABIV21_00545, partial [Pyrinomonadaceae bacterium]
MATEFDKLKQAVDNGARVINVSGLTSASAKACVLTRLQTQNGKSFAIVADSNTDLESWMCDLDFFASKGKGETESSGSQIIALPSFEADPYSGVSPHAETQERRALALWHLASGNPSFVVLSARCLIQRTVTPEQIEALGATLVVDKDFPPDTLVERLVAGGYVREDPLFGPGQFSVRGGIVDVWSPDEVSPVRIEFFGDT